MFNSPSKGFTLLELLIVIAILAVLAAVTVVVLNPAELLRQARDGQRVAQLSSLETAIGMFLVDGRGAPRGAGNTVHISLPDTTAPACGSHTLPALPSGWTYRCSSPANFRNINGTGWIPIDFTILPGGAPLAVLPIDPVNNTTHFLAYVTGGSYAVTAMPESSRFLQRNANRDGGTDPARIEAGTSRSLWARATGLVGYWPFENNFQDASGLANHGVQTGGVGFVPGRQGQAGRFDGVDDVVEVAHSASLSPTSALTVEVWLFWSGVGPAPDWNNVFSKRPATLEQYSLHLHRVHRVLHYCLIVGGVRGCTDSAHNSIPINAWIHIALTYDGAHQKAFINGTEVVSVARTGLMTTNTDPLRISAPHSFYGGLLDEFRIYNRALTADEIRAIFEATR